jgi:hypothetical protein
MKTLLTLLFILPFFVFSQKSVIGKTYNLNKRYDEHLSGCGSIWTRCYKPIKIVETIVNADKYDEDKYSMSINNHE